MNLYKKTSLNFCLKNNLLKFIKPVFFGIYNVIGILQINKRKMNILFKIIFFVCIVSIFAKKNAEEKPEWAKKDIRDFSDADMERLFDQWEEDEEPLPEDELPEHLRKPPSIDLKNLDTTNPEAVLQATKKGQTLMMFVTVANKPSRDRTEELTKIWQTSLWSNHIQAERYLIDDDRAIFMFKDGSQAWTAKEYLLEQNELKDVQLESQTYTGKNPDVKNKAVKDEL